MRNSQWLPRLLLALVTIPVIASAATPTYQTQSIEGWTVNIDTRLPAANKAATDRAVVLLTAQLKEIVRVVPAGPVVQLRKVKLWLSPLYPNTPARAEYHPSPIWLSQNGRNPAMAQGIEITNVLVYEAESQRMPLFVLHELAHAYADQVLAGSAAEIKAAFDRAVASKGYDAVQRFNGPGFPMSTERAYAMVSAGEYFAETTEAFFGRNDFQPFTREELTRMDPTMSALLQKVWQVPQTQPVPPPPVVASAFDVRCHYRLTTLWQGEGLSLDIVNDGTNTTPLLAKTALVSGQLWKLTPEASGAYRLTTQWRGPGFSLANTAGNRPLLVTTAAAPEQLWKVTPVGNGAYWLTNQAQAAALSLDIVNDGRNTTPTLAKTGSYSGQMWKVAPVGPCP
ncbi:RICIN domain-containing protein [Corallococcus sp. CA053C]|uniref:RICIN domain-containing protein n=1 Tax=Corallococcus sp. CA053C TaxID=2316732 RepID=UPI0013153619|nr:RICIN domain-containing protein [Corallococcus sp. CA053C]